jgi:RecB family exonuclease
MRDDGRLPLRASTEDLAVLREVALEAMDAFAAEEHVGHPALWELKKAQLLSDLAAVVEADPGADPLELERRFGFEDPESWPAIRFGDVHVRGIVDRVDRRPDGTLVVLDYKSSRSESLAAKLKEETLLAPEFQLALYAELLRQRGAGRVDAGYVSLKDARRTKTLRESGIDVDALPVAAKVLERVERMRAGRFEVRPLTCDYCELKPACRLLALPTDPDENGGEVSRG